MIGIYFSGTGNSKYAVEIFCREYDKETSVFSIEDSDAVDAISKADMLVIGYPVQYSTVPKILRDFVSEDRKSVV